MQPRWLAEAVNPRCLEARGRRVCGQLARLGVCILHLSRCGVAEGWRCPPLAPLPHLYTLISLCGLCVCARCTETVRTLCRREPREKVSLLSLNLYRRVQLRYRPLAGCARMPYLTAACR